jgi:hypothetical protein
MSITLTNMEYIFGTLCLCVGRGSFLPKSVATVWNVMEQAHEDMSAPLARHTIVIQIPTAVHYFLICV